MVGDPMLIVTSMAVSYIINSVQIFCEHAVKEHVEKKKDTDFSPEQASTKAFWWTVGDVCLSLVWAMSSSSLTLHACRSLGLIAPSTVAKVAASPLSMIGINTTELAVSRWIIDEAVKLPYAFMQDREQQSKWQERVAQQENLTSELSA